jgi:hypothetical protein
MSTYCTVPLSTLCDKGTLKYGNNNNNNCKDRDSFEDCLRENDVIPAREERATVRQLLANTKHAKLLLKTDQPAAHIVCC